MPEAPSQAPEPLTATPALALPPPPEDEFAAWFRLAGTPGLSRADARALLATLGSPEAVFDASSTALRSLLRPEAVRSLHTAWPEYPEWLANARHWLAGHPQRRVLTLGDPDYPAAWLQTEDPPLMVYLQGDVSALAGPALAIVGSRHATAQGLQTAQDFAAHLAARGCVIVSGLAEGIDAAAHEGALSVAHGRTVAVLGTGCDRVYPARHHALAHRVAAQGALLSEFAPGTPPLKPNFPLRNRLIAGLSRGTLVVEAAQRSGSLVTARLAAEAGREVFAIPGSIHSPLSRGPHALIRQGAKLVESADDLLDELPGLLAQAPASAAPTAARDGRRSRSPAPAPGQAGAPAPPAPAASGASREQQAVLEALGHEPMSVDSLSERTGHSVAELSAHLLELELIGHVRRVAGGAVQRVGRS